MFNGRDGEWRAQLSVEGRKAAALAVVEKVREQPDAGDLHLLFAPLKHARLDYLVQKSVEMGVDVIRPVITRYTQATRVNLERMRANAIEAAEQCGILAVPTIAEEAPFERAVRQLEGGSHGDFLRRGRARFEPAKRPVAASEPHDQVGRYCRPGRRVHGRGESACRRPRKVCPGIAGTANPASRYGSSGSPSDRPVGFRRLALIAASQ